jgi:hypothetical protein
MEPHKEEAKARYGLQRHIRRRRITHLVSIEGKHAAVPKLNIHANIKGYILQ